MGDARSGARGKSDLSDGRPVAMADERETCRIDGTHLQTLVDISTPHQLAHVVTRSKRKRSATTKKPLNRALGARKAAAPMPVPTEELATGSQPLSPMRDDEPELTIEREDTSTPIDQIAAKAEPEPDKEPEPLPPPPPRHRTGRDAMLGGLIGLALLAASWLAAVSF
jgi:hypothetical protein